MTPVDPQPQPRRNLWLRRLPFVAGLLAVGGLVGWASLRPLPSALPPPQSASEPHLAQKLAFDPRSAIRLVATVRWGHPEAKADEVGPTGQTVTWDGYLSLNCGAIEQVEPLGLELLRDDEGRPTAGDRMGPVVIGEKGDQRVYWRSSTGLDWDGVRVQVAACPRGEEPSVLRVVTPPRTYVARLDWTVDDFVSMPVGHGGASLDVHIAAAKDADSLQASRITAAPPPPPTRLAPVAESHETADPDDPAAVVPGTAQGEPASGLSAQGAAPAVGPVQ